MTEPTKALKALVRGGIPAALRPDLWLRFSGGLSRKAAAPPAYYASLVRRAALAPSGVLDAAELAVDLSRAFGAHAFLSSAKGLRSVLRLLEVCLCFFIFICLACRLTRMWHQSTCSRVVCGDSACARRRDCS